MSNRYADLIGKLATLDGPDREVDTAIMEIADPSFAGSLLRHAEPFTDSLDAAVALKERLLPWWRWGVTQGDNADLDAADFQGNVWPSVQPFNAGDEQFGYHPTPAIALLIATLKAHDNTKEANHG